MSLSSYTGSRRCRQLAVVIFAALSLAGCAGMGMPFTEAQSQAALSTSPSVVPAAVVKPRASKSVASSDWETVRRFLGRIPADAGASSEFAWHNAETGSDGTVSASATIAKSASLCRSFATTVNDIRGIRGYRGETCKAAGGDWKLYNIAPDDSTLL
jgi:surface antigen